MTQEDKQLLLKDLCGRLIYELKGLHRGVVQRLLIMDSFGSYQVNGYDAWFNLDSVPFKPYLRPMSSMIEEEFELLKQYSGLEYDQLDLAEFPNNHKDLDFYLSEIPSYTVIQVFDWLNAHHFDYRGLIPMGLALEAPEGMYE
jgi:hypothetical protein